MRGVDSISPQTWKLLCCFFLLQVFVFLTTQRPNLELKVRENHLTLLFLTLTVISHSVMVWHSFWVWQFWDKISIGWGETERQVSNLQVLLLPGHFAKDPCFRSSCFSYVSRLGRMLWGCGLKGKHYFLEGPKFKSSPVPCQL